MRDRVPDTAPDGSPVELYLALSPEPDLTRVCSVLHPNWSVLDLGSGPGRIANPLAADGHEVVVTYWVGSNSCTQAFDAAILDDAELDTMVAEVGLSVVDALDDDGEWVLLGATTE